jgi:patatin-like phospholipase/acyl hydrolase
VEGAAAAQEDAEELAMKRILALDGGGIRGVFTLEILLRVETLLRESTGDDKLVLADHFDLFAGTSTGAIIATCLCWGMAVKDILDLYVTFGKTMFTAVPWFRPYKKYLVSKYQAEPLSRFLRETFTEEVNGERKPAMLDSAKLRKALLVVVRNHTTGSAWPLTNNPKAKYNDPALPDCNMKVPLWQIVRASTAAPVYFDPEEIKLGDRMYRFVDGAVTPYNNPALIAALTATLPCYRMDWEHGRDKIRMVSVGTMRFPTAAEDAKERLWLGYYAAKIPAALIQGVAWQQDYLCRCLGECLYGEPLDSEIEHQIGTGMPAHPWFTYVRYNQTYKADTLKALLQREARVAQLDAISAIPVLRELGRKYADEHVRLEHL